MWEKDGDMARRVKYVKAKILPKILSNQKKSVQHTPQSTALNVRDSDDRVELVHAGLEEGRALRDGLHHPHLNFGHIHLYIETAVCV